MLEKNVPNDLSADAQTVLKERLPNHCHDCGEEVVLAGGQAEAKGGWYKSLDPVAMCERGCWQKRYAAGVDKEEGQEYRVAPGAEPWQQTPLGDVRGYCPEHMTEMVVTKDLMLGPDETLKGRQWKCPECSLESVAVLPDDG